MQKTLQLKQLLDAFLATPTVQVKELEISPEVSVTLDAIEKLSVTPSTIIIIRNFHYLQYLRNDPAIRPFAFNLDKLPNPIIAISELPLDDTDPFWAQFDECILATPPTQAFLTSLFEYYFNRWRTLIATRGIPGVAIDDGISYQWLAQNSAYCTVEDVDTFMNQTYYTVMRHVISNQTPSTGGLILTQDMLEDPDWKFMHETEDAGILSITPRDARRDQNVYLTRSKAGCVPSSSNGASGNKRKKMDQ